MDGDECRHEGEYGESWEGREGEDQRENMGKKHMI